MKIDKSGGFVYPSEQSMTPDGQWNQTYDPGITCRDWLAGLAMPTCISETLQLRKVNYAEFVKDFGNATATSVAVKWAYEIADQMIAEGLE